MASFQINCSDNREDFFEEAKIVAERLFKHFVYEQNLLAPVIQPFGIASEMQVVFCVIALLR